MKLKTSIVIISGCLIIFLFIMLPIFLSIQDKKDDYLSSFKGSSFSLTDINNNPITEKSFEGPLTAIFFGFTHCPDVCPMTLNKLDIIVDRLEKENKNLKVIFISIDPDRDTPKVMRDYINSFNSNFIGITGEPEKIFLLSRSWGIISEKIFSENGEYSVNHSSPVILLKNGKFVARLTHRDDIKQSLKIIKKHL
jgi:protein SCO1/2|tara:strand:+ start:871 stop:1455 length:585 start_codon:yes stop_codon:yes gene_type:complete